MAPTKTACCEGVDSKKPKGQPQTSNQSRNRTPQGKSPRRRASCCKKCSRRRTGETAVSKEEATLTRSTPKAPLTWFDSLEQENLRQSFLSAINKRRNRLSLPSVILEPLLNNCAAHHNYDQAFNMNGIGHKSSDGSKLSDRLKKVGYAFSWAGENCTSTGDCGMGCEQLNEEPGS